MWLIIFIYQYLKYKYSAFRTFILMLDSASQQVERGLLIALVGSVCFCLEIFVFLMQLINAISLEGYLWKQSPGVVKIYQKRYFAIRNSGEFIVWFGKKPNSIDVQPKGIIVTIRIETIKPDDFDDRVFSFNYNSRWFILRAENKDARDRWLRSITTIIEHLKKALKNKLGEIQSKPTDWKFQNASEEVVKSIRMENEKLLIREGEDSLYLKSGKQLASIIGLNASSDIQKCTAFGFLNKKAFIGSDQRWYFMYSEFNLNDERDDNYNERIKSFFENLNIEDAGEKHPNAEKNSSEQSSDEGADMQSNKHQFNCLYEYDIKTNALCQKINLTDVINFSKEMSQSPYGLRITFSIYDEKEEEEETKEILLQSDYMIEIEKWFKAFQIIFQRYDLIKVRQALLERRFQKYEIKMIKMNQETQWRMLGTNNKPDFVYVNRQILKISGHSFSIGDITGDMITTKMSILYKENPNDEGKNKEAIILSINFKQNRKLELAFENKDLLKSLKKKLKKSIKMNQEKELSKEERVNINVKQENNEDTYLIDKKIREVSGSIRVNFYEMMQREVPSAKQAKEEKPISFFDRFLQMFCGPPKQEDYLYS